MGCFQLSIHRNLVWVKVLYTIPDIQGNTLWSAKTSAFTGSYIITFETDKNNPSTSMVQTVFLSHAPYSNYKLIVDYLLGKKFSKTLHSLVLKVQC